MAEVHYVASGYVAPLYYQTGLSVDWNTRVIFVPRFFLTYISGTSYTLDTNVFRNALKDIEDSPIGMVYPDTHRHNTEVLLGGITYARVIEIINGYTVTFEDGQYSVNLVGSNNNIADVINLNQVSVRANNSAGLQVVNTTGGVGTVGEVANAVWNAAQASYLVNGSMGKAMSTAGTATDPWATDLSAYNTFGTAGYIAKNIDAETTTIINEIGNISVSSSAVNTPATAFLATSGVVVTGSYLDTTTFGVSEHHINGAGTAPQILDVRYEFNIGSNSIPSSFTFIGHALDQQEIVSVEAYDWVALQYVQIGEVTGIKLNNNLNFAMYTNQVGTGINAGKVWVRFYCSSISDVEIHVDQVYVSYATLAPTAAQVASQVRTELTPELTHVMQIPTTGTGLTSTQTTMLLEMYEILGLNPTKPLIVTDSSRTAGTISQNIATSPSETIVTRV